MRITANFNNLYANFYGKTIHLKTAPATAPLTADVFDTTGNSKNWTQRMKDEVAYLEAQAPVVMNENIDVLFDLRHEGVEMKHRANEKGEEVVDLFLRSAKTTKDGRKVELNGNILKEYSKNGEDVTRATEFEINPENPKEPIITRMIEKRPDGKYNLFLDGEYTEGFRLFNDDSETYERQVLMCEPNKTKGRYRFYSKGCKKDAMGNTFYEAATFKKANSGRTGDFETVDTFKIGERIFSDGAVIVDREYTLGAKYRGDAAENYLENYVRTPGGTIKIGKEMVSLIPMGLQSYRENYTKYPNAAASWSKYYTRAGLYSPWEAL